MIELVPKRLGPLFICRRQILGRNLNNYRYDTPLNMPNYIYPFFNDLEKEARKKEMFEARKLRILMRGVKIGKKKGGQQISLMSIFEKKVPKEEKKEEE